MKSFTFTEEDFRTLSEDGIGFCTKCREEAGYCEPDARGYECEYCGCDAVYGMEELLLMGLIEFEGEGEE